MTPIELFKRIFLNFPFLYNSFSEGMFSILYSRKDVFWKDGSVQTTLPDITIAESCKKAIQFWLSDDKILNFPLSSNRNFLVSELYQILNVDQIIKSDVCFEPIDIDVYEGCLIKNIPHNISKEWQEIIKKYETS